ncbi:Riboflavin synthase alpha chain, partial [Coemansia sp. RSA 1694]
DDEAWFTIMMIAYTQTHVIMPTKKIGELVNIEVDMLGKYVEKVTTSILRGPSSEAEDSSSTTSYIEKIVQRVIENNASNAVQTMEYRLRQLKRTLANANDEQTSDIGEQYRYVKPWAESQLADISERTATWSKAEKERVFELLRLGLTSPLMIAKHLGKTKSLRQVAEFLEYLSVCSALVGSDSDDVSEDSQEPESDGTQSESESESESDPESDTTTASSPKLRHSSRPDDTLSSSSSSSESESSSSSDSESRDSDRMSVDPDDGVMSVDSISSSAASSDSSDTEPEAADSASAGGSDGSSSPNDSDSDSDCESGDISVASENDQLNAKEEELALAKDAELDKKTITANNKLLKIIKKAPKEAIRHYTSCVLFNTDCCEALAKLIQGDDNATVNHAVYADMLQAVVHFIQAILKDSLAEQNVTSRVSFEDIFHRDCVYRAAEAAGFSARKPVRELYDDLLRKYLDEGVYDNELASDSEQAQ